MLYVDVHFKVFKDNNSIEYADIHINRLNNRIGVNIISKEKKNKLLLLIPGDISARKNELKK